MSNGEDHERKFTSFKEFYPFYLNEHSDRINRRLHFTGSLVVLLVLAAVVITRNWLLLLLVPVLGYGFAWIGHFFIEKNKPATFTYPLYSLMGDWKMFLDIITGKVKF